MNSQPHGPEQDKPVMQDEMMVSIRELGKLVSRVRRKQGMSREEAARIVGVEVETIVRAEDHRFGRMLRLRKRLLKRLAGYTIDGPFYQIRSLEEE